MLELNDLDWKRGAVLPQGRLQKTWGPKAQPKALNPTAHSNPTHIGGFALEDSPHGTEVTLHLASSSLGGPNGETPVNDPHATLECPPYTRCVNPGNTQEASASKAASRLPASGSFVRG